MRILQVSNQTDLNRILQDIKVDSWGIKIMVPKATNHLIRINSISCIAANILKQEMLSLGGDVAVARDALTGRTKKTDCLLIGNLSQFNRLNEKLNIQPFGLNKLASDLSRTLNNYQKDRFTIDLGRYRLNLGVRSYVMGIINLTPDSFSGDALYKNQRFSLPAPIRKAGRNGNYIIDFIKCLVKDGADIIDVGGESSRPGARVISIKEESSRTIPIIKILSKKLKVPISVDTCKPEIARQALDNGAVIVNDITGLRDHKMIKIIAKYKAAVVIMHMKGNPRTMQHHPIYESVIDETIECLDKAKARAICGGIDANKIIIDPGIGFGKTCEHNLEILKRLNEFKIIGSPILVGPSRKSFIGKILNAQPQERIFGTVSACVLAAKNGANIFRVHDVKAVKQSLKVLDAVNNNTAC